MSSDKDLKEATLPPCRVCSRRASGLHFGVITCEACKAFYKRSRGRERPFVCRGKEPGKCVIKNGKTPLCSYCRLQVCLKAGMCREGINKGRCPIEKKAELLLEAREHQQEVLRQKMLNERRGLIEKPTKTNNTEAPLKFEKKAPLPSVTPAAPNHSEPVHKLNSNSNSSDSNESFLGPTPSTQSNHLTSGNDVLQSRVCNTLQSPGVIHGSQQRGEFMNLLMDEDPFEVDHVGIFNANEAAYSFSGQRLMEIITWLDQVSQADVETLLYDEEETEHAQLNNATYKAVRKVREELMGPLKPLSHEVFTEVFNATGIDVDDYRFKPQECVQQADEDIHYFVEFLRRLPGFADHDLNDRLRLAKGGFTGWMLLSSINMYDAEGDCMSCSVDDGVVWTSDDFVRYFGPSFESALKQTLEVFQAAGLTQEEIAVLKVYAVYRDRPHLEPLGSGRKIKEQQDLINNSFIYLLESNRTKEMAKAVFGEVMQAMDIVEKVTAAFVTNTRRWPEKFPEFTYPRIWLELTGLEPEEELIVAVSTNLKIRD